VELTPSGQRTFQALRRHATDFDEQLRNGFTDDELTQLRGLLERLRDNAKGGSR